MKEWKVPDFLKFIFSLFGGHDIYLFLYFYVKLHYSQATHTSALLSLCSYEVLEKKLKEAFSERTGILRQLSKTSKELENIKGNLQVRTSANTNHKAVLQHQNPHMHLADITHLNSSHLHNTRLNSASYTPHFT